MRIFLPFPFAHYVVALFSVLLLFTNHTAQAKPQSIDGHWYQITAADWQYQGKYPLDRDNFLGVEKLSLTGGHYLFQADLVISSSKTHVIDFKNTSTIGKFRHFIFNQQHQIVAILAGGINELTENPFFLRHGREIQLPAGQYHLITELDSPFYLAQPELFVQDLNSYKQSIKWANSLLLICMGIFLGLGIYYAVLSLLRKRVAEGMYALFILGNILYNGTAQLLFSDLFGLHWIYLASLPILLSNCAYIVFVMALLDIGFKNHPNLYKAGIASLGILVIFILLSFFLPNWTMEFARYGVGLFLIYGLTVGIIRALQGSSLANYYLVAIVAFFLLGGIAITQNRLLGVYAFNIEHIGILAVAVEVILLSLVITYQFVQLHSEKEVILRRLSHSNRIAHTDPLTGLLNRYKLDQELKDLPSGGSLTYIDLDRLKYYNDRFGHERGDELICMFATNIAESLDKTEKVFRVGGDEFAITSQNGNKELIEKIVNDAIQLIHTSGFQFAGASFGTAFLSEVSQLSDLKRLADQRMYGDKKRRKGIEIPTTSD